LAQPIRIDSGSLMTARPYFVVSTSNPLPRGLVLVGFVVKFCWLPL
jgi:hypothetical protein